MRRGGMGMRRGGGFGGRSFHRHNRRPIRRHRRRRRRRILLIGGLVAFGIYKMSKRDAERIEEDAGKPPEEMTDAELEYEMEKLQIEKQYRDESDREIAEEDTTQGSVETDYMDELEKLAKLKDDGIITKEEFETKKKQILGI